MKNVAIITARGGSKRIPKKNIREFCGKPIIAYSIAAALDAGVFDEVMVSTDSREIAEIAREYGAAVPFMRSEETSNDFATTSDVLEEVVASYEAAGQTIDRIACIYPTAPFLTGEKIRDAMAKLDGSDSDSIMSVVRFGFPPQRALVIRDGKLAYQYPEHALTRSQDLEPVYHDCGQFYICDTVAFRRNHSMITPDTIPFVIDEDEVQDIDNPSDWTIAEAKYSVLREGGR